MVEEAKEIENSESPAVRLMRLSYIERIGTLLGIMIGEDISTHLIKHFIKISQPSKIFLICAIFLHTIALPLQ